MLYKRRLFGMHLEQAMLTRESLTPLMTLRASEIAGGVARSPKG